MFLSGEGLFRLPASPALTGVLRSQTLTGGECVRVGEAFLENESGANRTPSQQEVPKQFGDRLVTEGSRLVTRPILLVNTGVRKHWISVSGVTRRTFRRAATPMRDDRLRGYEIGDFSDEPWSRLSPI